VSDNGHENICLVQKPSPSIKHLLLFFDYLSPEKERARRGGERLLTLKYAANKNPRTVVRVYVGGIERA
jgi:hypothetical protein